MNSWTWLKYVTIAVSSDCGWLFLKFQQFSSFCNTIMEISFYVTCYVLVYLSIPTLLCANESTFVSVLRFPVVFTVPQYSC